MDQELSKAEVENCFTTRFILPGWWVRAYEAAVTKPIQSSALEQIMAAGLAPALNQMELNGLADLLATIQRQILFDKDSGPRIVTIDPQRHVKHSAVSNPAWLHSFERTLFGLSGIRVLTQNGHCGHKTVRLVQDERWDTDPQHERCQIQLSLAEEAPELFLGYTNNYLELSRVAEGRREVLPLQHEFPPLSVWRSPWVDLQGVDQLLLLRLEKAMQWSFSWLQLDGVFGASFAQLLRGVPNQQETLTGMEALKIIERVGKKLYDHGLLTFDVSDQYLTMNEQNTFLLAWQVTRDRLHEHEAEAYARKVRQFFLHQIAQSRHDRLMAALSGQSSYGTMVLSLVNQWQELVSDLSENEVVPVAFNQTSHPVLGPLLFLEWSLRCLPGHPLPLPEDMLYSEAVRCCDPFATRTMQDRYREFSVLLRDQSEYQQMLHGTLGASFAAPIMLGNKDFREYLRRFSRGAQELRPTPEPDQDLAHPLSQSAYAGAGAPRQPAAQRNIVRPSFNLKKLAEEELEAMQRAADGRYDELKRTYITSLDNHRRGSLLDVEKRMQKEQFEALLRNHLLRFMIENPGSWKSSKPVKSRVGSRPQP